MVTYYNDLQIAAALDIDALIDTVEEGLAAFSSGRVLQPLRTRIDDEESGGTFFLMPAATSLFALKIVTKHPGNHDLGLPSHNASVVVLDRATGIPRALLDGNHITQMRTAAVSAAAARRLSAPEARVLAILGSGAQARGHYETMRRIRNFDEVRVWARNPEKAALFAKEIGALRCESAKEAVIGADVIATTTSAITPILNGEWLKPGAHVSSVGWNGIDSRELDDTAMENVIFVESREAASLESGNIRLSGARIHAEMGEVFANTVDVDISRTTVFVSVGMAVLDAYAADLVLSSLNRSASTQSG